jgi:hypothetical protein
VLSGDACMKVLSRSSNEVFLHFILNRQMHTQHIQSYSFFKSSDMFRCYSTAPSSGNYYTKSSKNQLTYTNYIRNDCIRRSQWPRGLRRGSAAARLLGSWVRIPPRAWMSVCCECCVLSGRGLCDGLVPRPEESYRLWCV